MDQPHRHRVAVLGRWLIRCATSKVGKGVYKGTLMKSWGHKAFKSSIFSYFDISTRYVQIQCIYTGFFISQDVVSVHEKGSFPESCYTFWGFILPLPSAHTFLSRHERSPLCWSENASSTPCAKDWWLDVLSIVQQKQYRSKPKGGRNNNVHQD